MIPDGDGAGRRRRKKRGAHRVPRQRSAVTRIVAAGGAAACIGVAYEAGTPIAEALSIVIPLGGGNGNGNTMTINIFEGNIFDPQLGIGGNVSNNSTIGNVAVGNGNGVVSELSSADSGQMVLGTTAGNGNTMQINILSYNIINPQWSLRGGNVSNNTTVGNVAMDNGNNSSVLSAGGFLTAWASGMTGNGNTTQLAFLSGNIFNPQWSMSGENISNNTAITNVAIGNGNQSSHQVLSAGFLGTTLFGGLRGNGNTNQVAAVASNIFNPQFTFGGGNTSNNTAVTNNASGNGNGSSTDVSSSGGLGNTSVFGTSGNGNTTQTATGSGNISNDQINIGINPVGTNSNVHADQQQSLSTTSSASSDDSDDSFSSRITAAVNRALGSDRRTTSRSDDSPGGTGTLNRTRSSNPRGSAADRPAGFGNPADSDDRPAGSGGGGGSADSGDGASDSGDKGDK